MRTIEIWSQREGLGILFTEDLPGVAVRDDSLIDLIAMLTRLYGKPDTRQVFTQGYIMTVKKWSYEGL